MNGGYTLQLRAAVAHFKEKVHSKERRMQGALVGWWGHLLCGFEHLHLLS